MRTLLFIGLAFHQKTQSVTFLKELLERDYLVTYCFVDTLSDDPYAVFNEVQEQRFDVLVCCQVTPPRYLIDRHFQFTNATLFPMFDSCPRVSATERWFPYRDFHIICFCRTLADGLRRSGFAAQYVQFFPTPYAFSDFGDPSSVFFWNRRERINIRTVERLFAKTPVDHAHIHKALDPGNHFVPPSADGPLTVSYSEWFPSKEEMTLHMLRCAYYMAPRRKEGIGMSFLEAMAMGRCVVAPDFPTMNEYIIHGRTGLLYNPRNPKPISYCRVRDIQERAYEYMVEGFGRWEKEKDTISERLVRPIDVSRSRIGMRLAIRFPQKPAKVVNVLKTASRRLHP